MTWEDQQDINSFSKLNNKFHELEAKITGTKVREEERGQGEDVFGEGLALGAVCVLVQRGAGPRVHPPRREGRRGAGAVTAGPNVNDSGVLLLDKQSCLYVFFFAERYAPLRRVPAKVVAV